MTMQTSGPLSPAHSGTAAGMATGELSDWVNRIRSGSGAAARSPATQTGSNLEDEVKQSRLDRQQRRNRLSGQGVRGFSQQDPSPALSPSHTGGRGEEAVVSRDSTPLETGRRGAALLSRYGGAAGPTGTANAGSGDSPVSLASFMGGRAAGPRLGKLTGDGRSAPPEAGLIDESRSQRGIALPGMSPTEKNGSGGEGRSLASFLEARAASTQGSTPSQPRTTLERASSYQSASSRASKVTDTQVPTSPVRRSTSPSKSASPSKQSSSPEKTTSRALPQAINATSSYLRPNLNRNSSSQNSMKHASTSPIRQEDIAAGGVKSITPSPSPSLGGLASHVEPSGTTQAAPYSPAFASLHRESSIDRQPTASLTRLKGKGMVGQRLKEAKEREEREAGNLVDTGAPSSRITAPRFQMPDSPTKHRTAPTSAAASPSPLEKRWSPHRSGQALPGLSRPLSSGGARTTASSVFRSPSPERSATAPDTLPVRLPGMGGPTSPFGVSEGRATSPKKTSFFAQQSSGVESPTDAASQPLQPLTTARAKGPVRRTPRSGAAAIASTETTPITAPDTPTPVAEDTTPATPSAPLRSTRGPRIVVLISGSGSNLQALIDATHIGGPLSNAQISFVLSNRKAAFGLTRAATSNPPIPTHILALKTWQNRNPGGTREQYDEVLAKAVLDGEGAGSPPDLIVLAGFMHIVSPIFLRALGHQTDLPAAEAPAWRPNSAVPIINLHPALPGAFDGANAIPRAFEAYQRGEIQHTGIMVHEVVAEVDRGAPVLVREVPISRSDTLETLEEKMHKVEHSLIVEATGIMLERVKQGLTQTQAVDERTPQSPEKAPSSTLRNSGPTSTPPVSSSAGSNTPNARAPLRRHRTGSRPSSLYGSNLAAVREASNDGNEPASSAPAASARTIKVRCSEQPNTGSGVSRRRIAALASSLRQGAIVPRLPQTLSLESLLIHGDGTTSTLKPTEAHVLHDGETQAIVHRFRPSPTSETVSTQLYARSGTRSALSKGATSSREARKLADLAIRFSTKLIDARQGREPLDLALLFPSKTLETRQGSSRSAWDSSDSMLFQVSSPEPAHGAVFIDQVDLSAASLTSAASFVLSVVGNVLLWHGAGSTDVEREAARNFAQSTLRVSKADIVEMEEGTERGMWWDVLGSQTSFANAWHHRRRRLHASGGLASLQPRLLLVTRSGGEVEEHLGTFGSQDIPTDGISIVVLPTTELYVLIGPDARSKRTDIHSALNLASSLADPSPARLAAHVVVYPSVTPRDLVSHVRFWNEHEAGLRRGSGRMNVVTLQQAQRELSQWFTAGAGEREVDARLVEDRGHLPVGLGEEDIALL